MLFNHFIAVLSAIILSTRFCRGLNIKPKEWKRYYLKSLSLGLCYAGFSDVWNLKEAWRSGEAAFFCCAYDVVTDWRGFDTEARRTFEDILKKRTSDPTIPLLAMGLYEKEASNQLEDDGLERGAASLRLILKLMKCEASRELVWGDLDEIGRVLQIADDVLDYEHDLHYGDLNCLISPNRDIHLRHLISRFDPAEKIKPFGRNKLVLSIAIEKAREKAAKLLYPQASSKQETIPSNIFASLL